MHPYLGWLLAVSGSDISGRKSTDGLTAPSQLKAAQ